MKWQNSGHEVNFNRIPICPMPTTEQQRARPMPLAIGVYPERRIFSVKKEIITVTNTLSSQQMTAKGLKAE